MDKEIKNLLQKGVRLFCYVTPHLNTEGALYQRNKGNDYFVKNHQGEDYVMDFGQFNTVSLDITRPEAVTWFKSIHSPSCVRGSSRGLGASQLPQKNTLPACFIV